MSERKTIKLKVCGMRSPENILEVAKLFPDYMGFIFFRGSKRYVGEEFAIPVGFPNSIKKVGVFVNESSPEIIRLARLHNLDFIQLHGDEKATHCGEIKSEGFNVIKAFSIDQSFNFAIVDDFKDVVDFVLFDTKSVNYGGSGIAFDWSMLKSYGQEIPFFLSGGISAGNIDNLLQLKGMNIHAIDINSQVEKAVGIKNVELIRKIGAGADHYRINESTN